jgi:hypothetical protein
MENLTPEQKKSVTEWVQEGSNLADVQKRLREEFSISLTYMDVRLLVIEMGLKVKEKVRPVSVDKDLSKGPSPASGSQSQDEDWGDEEQGGGPQNPPGTGSTKVTVTVDRIVKPGTLVSGNVTFSDGVSMGWGLDQFGRLALSGGKAGHKPSQQDLMAFQTQLRRLIEQKGF